MYLYEGRSVGSATLSEVCMYSHPHSNLPIHTLSEVCIHTLTAICRFTPCRRCVFTPSQQSADSHPAEVARQSSYMHTHTHARAHTQVAPKSALERGREVKSLHLNKFADKDAAGKATETTLFLPDALHHHVHLRMLTVDTHLCTSNLHL